MTDRAVLAAMMTGEGEVRSILEELLHPPAFHRDALCQEHPSVSFFPPTGVSTEPAKAICRRCLVRRECLEYALANGEEHGVWGGMSPAGREALRRSHRAA